MQEVRAWTIHQGDTDPEAAGVIHSDFQKGYIRAEVMAYKDFITLGSEVACRAAGKQHVEGKEYRQGRRCDALPIQRVGRAPLGASSWGAKVLRRYPVNTTAR